MSDAILGLFSSATGQTVAACVLFVLGLALIVKGGDVFVDAATWMAEATGIPKFIVGATVVSVATTLPELIVSCLAAAQGSASMAIGNAVGSVTANTGLIMGISLIFAPLVIRRSELTVKGGLLLLSIAGLLLLCLNGALTVWESVLVLLLFGAFIVENLYSASHHNELTERPKVTKKIIGSNVLKFLLGAGMLALGSNLLVDNGQFLAVDVFHVDVRIVAITLVAIGTSLPELVTAVTALVKKQGSMSVGNIIGANIIDVTLILPICTLISGGSLVVEPNSVRLDMPVCLAEAAIAIIPTLIFKRFTRLQGVLMVALYLAYLVYSIVLL